MMAHPCDKLCDNKTASGYCATTTCINPQYSNIGTAQYGQGIQKRIITNADRLRAMSDEEAKMLKDSYDRPYEDRADDTLERAFNFREQVRGILALVYELEVTE